MEENQNPIPPVTKAPSPTPIVSETPIPNPIKPASKFSLKLIIGIIIFLLLAGGAAAGYVYREPLMSLVSKPSPTPAPIVTITPTPDPTADWKTYEGNNISFKYRSQYSISQTKVQNLIASLMSPLNPTPRKSYELIEDSELKVEFLEPVATTKSLAEIILEDKKRPNERSSEPLNFEEKDLKIGGYAAKKLSTQYSIVYYVIVNNDLYKVIQYPPITSRQNEFDQILSTFKFTDEQMADASDMKIYKNDRYDFEFYYPKDFKPTFDNESFSSINNDCEGAYCGSYDSMYFKVLGTVTGDLITWIKTNEYNDSPSGKGSLCLSKSKYLQKEIGGQIAYSYTLSGNQLAHPGWCQPTKDFDESVPDRLEEIYLSDGKYVFRFDLRYRNKSTLETTYKKILSTFRFTK